MKLTFMGWPWVGKVVLLVGLVIGSWWLGRMVRAARVERETLTQGLLDIPERLSAEARQHTALAQHREALQQLQRLLPDQPGVGALASVLEQEGTRQQVTVALTDLKEVEERDASGVVLPPRGPVRDIRITGVVRGVPGRLLDWLGAVERLPYLLRVEAWKLQVVAPGAEQATSVVVPPTSPMPSTPPAELSFSLLLSIRYADQVQP